MNRYTKLERCRISNSRNLVPVLDLGEQALTGVFPHRSNSQVTTGPLRLVWCPESGLVQLDHSYDPEEIYGANYGYRSGLNQSMVRHLSQKVRELEFVADLHPGETVLDIGSNDATTLKSYKTAPLKRIGIDPTGGKFREFYSDDISLVPEFFSAEAFLKVSTARAKVVTSIAMFYDLEDPVSFAQQIERILAPGGVWHFEQSYLPSMLRMTSYDTVCHEHLEYYSFKVVARILDAAGMRAIDVKMNAVNGGSFAVTATRKAKSRQGNDAVINWLLEQEDRAGLDTSRPYREFEERVYQHRGDLFEATENLGCRPEKSAWLRCVNKRKRCVAILRH